MKIAYYINLDILTHSGITKKIITQINVWKKNHQDVIVFCIVPENCLVKKSLFAKAENIKFYFEKHSKLPVEKIKDLINLDSVYKTVEKDITLFDPDLIYYRNDFYFPLFLKRLSKKFKLIAEINTDQISEAKLRANENFKGFIIYFYFLLIKGVFRKSTAGFVAVTQEIAIDYKNKFKVCVIPNSIEFKNYDDSCDNQEKSERSSMVFIGTPNMPWQGVDIIEELALKLPSVEFNIIGILKPNKNNLIYHGFLNYSEYRKIILKSDVGLGTLGLFRKNMQEACPLKVREYLFFQKPIIIAYNDTAFEKYGYPEWVLKLPNSKQGILDNIKDIETFVLKNKGYKIDLNEAKKYADANTIELERINFFKEIVELT